MDKISIVVPCYNEEEVIVQFYKEIELITAQMSNQTFEFLFIDDGSKDKTLDIIKKLHQKDERVRFVSFSRNFGKEAGLYAGLQNATGDFVVVMDVDLQDPPAMLPEMYKAVKEQGYDCAGACRMDRQGEPPIRSAFAKLFYKIINKISDTDIVDGARDFRMMSKKMVNAILSMSEYNRFSKGIFGWVGFKTKWMPYSNVERAAGSTKWSFWSLLIYALNGVFAFSTAPLLIASLIGIILCVVSFVMVGVIIFKTLVFGESVAGYPSLICALFFLSGIQLFCIGIVGQYLAKLYLEAKNRPVYIVDITEEDMDKTKTKEIVND